jgi:signal transduction histidine kinase
MPFSSRRSLAVKLPLLSSMLLLIALAAMSVVSYLELRTALVDTATGRLQQAADRMATVFSMSARQRVIAMQQLMARPDARALLRARDGSQQPSIDAAITAYLGNAIEIADVELWDAAGKRIFAAGASFDEVTGAAAEAYKTELSRVDEASIGKLHAFTDGLQYAVGGRISQDGQVLGYVVERRRISNPAQTQQTVQLLTGLIGSEATMVIGNADGSMWSDFSTALRDVPIAGNDSRMWEYQRAGMPDSYAWATPIDTTPWVVAIEFPRAVVLEPSERFIVRSLVIGSLLLFVAAASGWAFTRRMMLPLVRVTEAAEAVAETRSRVQVDVHREDEIGRLADAFNTMAVRVELARTDLELRVELQTSELRAANRELEAFSYSVSHDLRAPLRAIAGFVQILEEDHADQLDETARRHLGRVRINAQRMGQLIDDLLSFSRIGRATMVLQTIDLTQIATAVAQEAIAASGRAIDLTIEPLPPCYGEGSLVNQVFVNLVSNAVKFTATVPGPAITIGTTAVEGETVYFVRDNGVGFDERYAEKLFGVFQRLHRRDDFDGTGVGLAIVHRIISRHGGRIWAEGRLNAGATFYFTLPAPPAPS